MRSDIHVGHCVVARNSNNVLPAESVMRTGCSAASEFSNSVSGNLIMSHHTFNANERLRSVLSTIRTSPSDVLTAPVAFGQDKCICSLNVFFDRMRARIMPPTAMMVLGCPLFLSEILRYTAFPDLASFQRVCKAWWDVIARRVRHITLGVLSRWFDNPTAILAAMTQHNATITATVALRVARRLGFYQQSLPKEYFHRDEVGQVPRATIVLPNSDCAELVCEPLNASMTLTIARYNV